MKWNFIAVFVLCVVAGILSAPAVDEENSSTSSSTTVTNVLDEGTVATYLGAANSPSPSPETASTTTTESLLDSSSLSPEMTESAKVDSPATESTNEDIAPTDATTVSAILDAQTTPEGQVTDSPTSTSAEEIISTSETSEVTTSEAPDDVQTTTAESWFTWITGVKSDGEAEATEAGTTTEMSAVTSSVDLVEVVSTTTTEPTDSSTTVETATSSESINASTQNITNVANRLSDQVRAVLQHYKNPDPTGFPGAPVPDPMSIPDMSKSFAVAKMNFTHVQVYGLSKFRIEQVNTDLEKMQVYVQLHIKKLIVLGNYTLRSWFNKAAGPFTVNLYDVVAEGAAALQPDEKGHLQASDSDMDMTFKDIDMDFKNIGLAGSLVQGMVSSVGAFIFDSIKPHILKEVNTNMRQDLNAKIQTITSKLPSNISPVDLAISEGRKYIVNMGYDPYTLRDFHFEQSILHINVSELTLKGLSQFYRVNDITLTIDRNVVQIGLQLVTKQLAGSCSWAVSLGRRGKLARSGASNFTVDHLQIRAFVNQSLDIRHGPVLDDLDIEVGKVKLTMDGRGSLDYVIEVVVNQLPDLIRHIIVDALEDPIKYKVQEILDEVNLEEIVESKLPELDKFS